MTHPLSSELQKTVESWQYFAPCLGTNIALYDAKYGYWHSATGFKAINPCQALETNELFYIYSITKTFTAIVVMQLVESGLVSLDTPITKYLNYLQLPQGVTVKRLLNHTSGVPNYTTLADYATATREKPASPWSFDYVIERTCKENLDFAPGKKWCYSNTGYMLLLLMIEAVTRKSFAENINNLVIKKVGLTHTYVAENVDHGMVTNGYCRYLNDDEEMQNITKIYNPWWCKTGLIVSTATEVTQLYQALFAGRLIDKKYLSYMIEATAIEQSGHAFFAKPSYGFGLMIDAENEYGEMYGHGGDGPGFNTWSAYYPNFYNRSVGLTVLCNTSIGGHPFYLVKDMLNVLKKA